MNHGKNMTWKKLIYTVWGNEKKKSQKQKEQEIL
jgi:hypothetical protein